jgi:hypothetical protein
MKGFRAYITERLAIEDNPNAFTPPTERYTPSAADIAFDRRQAARYSTVMARIAAQVLAKAKRKSGVKTQAEPRFPWLGANNTPGWWHPKHSPIVFPNKDDNYHVTQIVRNPKAFGISTAELNRGLAAEAAYLRSRGIEHFDHEGNDYEYDEDFVRADILKGKLDLAYEVQRVAYMKGWLKVYSGVSRSWGSPFIEGINRDSIRKALAEINDAKAAAGRTDNVVVEVKHEGLTRFQDTTKYIPSDKWQTA